ncbi:MAG: hypothetical protein M1828_000949 [Chrysothrix sp. TS-e1954]|nr:MAG: hypothetical protein M1828_000949 [Chrysothrix sp. TS-e1954]
MASQSTEQSTTRQYTLVSGRPVTRDRAAALQAVGWPIEEPWDSSSEAEDDESSEAKSAQADITPVDSSGTGSSPSSEDGPLTPSEDRSSTSSEAKPPVVKSLVDQVFFRRYGFRPPRPASVPTVAWATDVRSTVESTYEHWGVIENEDHGLENRAIDPEDDPFLENDEMSPIKPRSPKIASHQRECCWIEYLSNVWSHYHADRRAFLRLKEMYDDFPRVQLMSNIRLLGRLRAALGPRVARHFYPTVEAAYMIGYRSEDAYMRSRLVPWLQDLRQWRNELVALSEDVTPEVFHSLSMDWTKEQAEEQNRRHHLW